MKLWPPYLGAGINITHMSKDVRRVEVEMKLRFWNRNLVGTQFGGSLYALVDPFYMLMLIENLGPKYLVWDKAANIRFKKPGKGTVRATFELSAEQIDSIRKRADDESKVEPTFVVQILDDSNEVVAEVDKLLWVKRKDKLKPRSN